MAKAFTMRDVDKIRLQERERAAKKMGIKSDSLRRAINRKGYSAKTMKPMASKAGGGSTSGSW